MPASADGGYRRIKNKRRRMEARSRERQNTIESQLQGWMEQFDVDKNNRLDREELSRLLTHLQPDYPPTSEMLDHLCVKASEIRNHTTTIAGRADASIPWHDVRATVVRYLDYCKEQKFLDRVFQIFDPDGSNSLEPSELPALLKAVAPRGVKVGKTDVQHVLKLADADGVGCTSLLGGMRPRPSLPPHLARVFGLSSWCAAGRQDLET
mmetsp:Transcript_15806/g.40112  ORF Transcript_15806/g.40112 Transcript_15806/m.40112 type:complete len:209 (-) Transcript_15806:96-722(-)